MSRAPSPILIVPHGKLVAVALVLVATLALVAPLAACGGGDEVDDVCDGRPCLTTIDDAADWAAISVPHAPDDRCDFLEESKFLMPASVDAALQQVVFQDVGAHRLHLDFMTQVLPEYFGGLSLDTYQRIVQRRATRQYWAGALYRVVDATGATTGYGFDVVVEPTVTEQLSEAEVAAIAAQLQTRFHLPLRYAPVDDVAIWNAQSFEALVPVLPRACQLTQCATAGVDCVEIPAALAVCGQFWEGRELVTELANKARVEVAARVLELPRGLGTSTVPAIFGAGELGGERAALTPVGTTARYQVFQPSPGYTTRLYTQDFTVDGAPYQLQWAIPVPEEGGGFVLTDVNADHHFDAHLGPTGSMTNDRLSRLGSCTNSTLESWQRVGTLAGGDGFTIDFRFAQPLAGSGPLFVTGGAVTLGGATATVDDYFRLVYAGQHHNWNNQFWVLFAEPLTYAGHPVHGLWLDEADFTPTLDAAYTLDAERQPLDRLDVTTYTVQPRR